MMRVCSLLLVILVIGCTSAGRDPNAAKIVAVDRFSDAAGHLYKRSAPLFNPAYLTAIIPAPNDPIPLDLFLTSGLGPNGEKITYYGLDEMSHTAGQVYVFPDAPEQLPVLTAIPGDPTYNDFMLVTEVRATGGYTANTLTSAAEIAAAVTAGDVTTTDTTRVVNWAVVPHGSSASRKFAGADPTGFRAWYDDQIADLFEFDQNLMLTPPPDGKVPSTPIIVIFANGMDPSMGFAAEPNGQTHNVLAALPGDPYYSSLWDHTLGKLSGFASVVDFDSAAANIQGPGGIAVNCPVVAP
jgi:hypothetical protein